jgi:hypothetical protein
MRFANDMTNYEREIYRLLRANTCMGGDYLMVIGPETERQLSVLRKILDRTIYVTLDINDYGETTGWFVSDKPTEGCAAYTARDVRMFELIPGLYP